MFDGSIEESNDMLKKNDIIELEISGLTSEGSGVGRYEGIAVFVPFTAVGDVIGCRIVKVKSRYCYGIIERIIVPSTDRKDSGCARFGKCGGCSLRHIEYKAELAAKEKIVRDAFLRIGGMEGIESKFEPIVGSERTERYRNKAQFPVSADESGNLCTGFYARHSHRVVGSADCLLLPEIFSEICTDILDYANSRGVTAYDEVSGEGLLRHIYLRRGEHSGEIMAALIVTSADCTELFEPLARQLSEKYSELRSFLINVNDRRTNAILGERVIPIYGGDCIHDEMCGKRVAISLHSFYQINTSQAERLYGIAAEYAELSGREVLLDLYCGIGTIGLSMSGSVSRLIGVEIVPQAIENAKRNAYENGIGNAEFICADAGTAAAELFSRGLHPDVIICDPARKGCTRDALDLIAKMSPEKIIMISCNPATAARDCAVLCGEGYRVGKVRAVDLFPGTEHVETVCLMSRREK